MSISQEATSALEAQLKQHAAVKAAEEEANKLVQAQECRTERSPNEIPVASPHQPSSSPNTTTKLAYRRLQVTSSTIAQQPPVAPRSVSLPVITAEVKSPPNFVLLTPIIPVTPFISAETPPEFNHTINKQYAALIVTSSTSPPSQLSTESRPSSISSQCSSTSSFQSPPSTDLSCTSSCTASSSEFTPNSGLSLEFLSPSASPPPCYSSSSSTSTNSGALSGFSNPAGLFSPSLLDRTSSVGSETESIGDPSRLASCSSMPSASPKKLEESPPAAAPTAYHLIPYEPALVSRPDSESFNSMTVTISSVEPQVLSPSSQPSLSPESAKISEEQQQHIASLVRKTKQKKKKKSRSLLSMKPPTGPLVPSARQNLMLACPSPAVGSHPTPSSLAASFAVTPSTSFNLPTIRSVGQMTPISNRLTVPSPAGAMSSLALKSPMQSPSIAFVSSPRNFNLFRLKLPTAAAPDGEEYDTASGGPDGSSDSFSDSGTSSGDEDEEEDDFGPMATPGNAGLGAEEEFGEIILCGIHQSGSARKNNGDQANSRRVTEDQDATESESDQTPLSHSVPSAIPFQSKGASIMSTQQDLQPDSTSTFDTTRVDAAAEDSRSGSRTERNDHTPELARQGTEQQLQPNDQPPSLAARRTKFSRRATLSGTIDTKLRSAPYDFNPAGALLIDGWEISKKGVTRTPEVSSRRLSLSGTASCGNSPMLPVRMLSTPNASFASAPNSQTNTPTLLGRRLSLVKAQKERFPSAGELTHCAAAARGGQGHERNTTIASAVSSNMVSDSLPEGDILSSLSRIHSLEKDHSASSDVSSTVHSAELDQLACSLGPKFKLPKAAPGLGIELKLSDLVRIGEIGRGVNGAVHKAIYLPTLSIVALKSVSIFDKDERHQFLQELRAFLNCSSDQMVRFIGACFCEGKITMALEYLNRGSLDHVVQRSGPLSEPVLRLVAQQLLMGIRDLHEKAFLHRDIKPANFLIDNRGVAKVSDFGLLKQLVANESGMLEDKKFVGTMLYLAPERIAGQAFSFPSDIYAVGLSMIFLATGALQQVPRDYWAMVQTAANAPPPSLPPMGADGSNNFSKDLRDFVDRMMKKDPAQRWTAAQLLAHPWFINEESRTPCSPTDPLQSWPGRELQQPDPEELAILVDAVMERWYPMSKDSPTAAAATPSLSSDSPVYQPAPCDLKRFGHLAQQLGWDERPLIDGFVERMRERLAAVAHENPSVASSSTSSSTNATTSASLTNSSSSSSLSSTVSESFESIHPYLASTTASASSSFSMSNEPSYLHYRPSELFSRSQNSSPHGTPIGSPRRPPKAPRSACADMPQLNLSGDSAICETPPRSVIARRLSASGRRATFNARMSSGVECRSADSSPLIGVFRKLATANQNSAALNTSQAPDSPAIKPSSL